MAQEDEDAELEDLLVEEEESKPVPEPVPDVGAARAALDAVITLKGHVDIENNLLSEHLMVFHPSSFEFMGKTSGALHGRRQWGLQLSIQVDSNARVTVDGI